VHRICVLTQCKSHSLVYRMDPNQMIQAYLDWDTGSRWPEGAAHVYDFLQNKVPGSEGGITVVGKGQVVTP
jgi:hypothetical protein